MSFQDIAPIIISFTALIIVVYQEFIRGYHLHISVDQIGIPRMANMNKEKLVVTMIANDMMSSTPSRQALELISKDQILEQALSGNDREQIIQSISTLPQRIGGIVEYTPTDTQYQAAIHDQLVEVSFFIPIFLHNSGKKSAHLRTIILQLVDPSDKSAKWIFSPFVELDPKIILDRTREWKDSERIRNIFAGVSISGGNSATLMPWFIRNKPKTEESMPPPPGEYNSRLLIYDNKGTRVANHSIGIINIRRDHLISSIKGGDSITYLRIEEDVSDALGV